MAVCTLCINDIANSRQQQHSEFICHQTWTVVSIQYGSTTYPSSKSIIINDPCHQSSSFTIIVIMINPCHHSLSFTIIIIYHSPSILAIIHHQSLSFTIIIIYHSPSSSSIISNVYHHLYFTIIIIIIIIIIIKASSSTNNSNEGKRTHLHCNTLIKQINNV